MGKVLMVKKINDKFEPTYEKGWQQANSQFWVNKDKLYIVYEEDDEAGLTDVSNQYEWKLIVKPSPELWENLTKGGDVDE